MNSIIYRYSIQLDESKGKALQLVYFSQNEGFKMSEEGIEFISSLKGKLGVIAVAGKYRTGKSFLLNRIILNLRESGFGVGPTINPCTKGIWVWNETIKIKQGDEDINCIVLDSEGLGAFDEDQTHDTRIFLLSTLLSSFFIYNSMGAIDESALNSLSLIVNMSKQLQIKIHSSQEGDNDPDQMKHYFPSFMWVLRDFSLQLVDQEGNKIHPNQYLEKSLDLQRGTSDSIESKNRIRRLIKTFFEERECCTLIRPVENEDTMQNLQALPDADFRPEFFQQLRVLRTKVLKKVRYKTLNGRMVTGEMLVELCQAYLKAFNTGGVPCIESAWNYVCTSQCTRTIQDSLQFYKVELQKKMGENIKLDHQAFKDIHRDLKNKALKELHENGLGENIVDFESQLRKNISETYSQMKTNVNENLVAQCNKFLSHKIEEMEDKIRNNQYASIVDLRMDLEGVKKWFIEKGPKYDDKEKIFSEIMDKLVVKTADSLTRNSEQNMQIETRHLNEKIINLEHDVVKLKSMNEIMKDGYEQKLEDLRNGKAKAVAAENILLEKVERLEKAKDEIDQLWRKQLQERDITLINKENDTRNKLMKLEEMANLRENEKLRMQHEFDKEKAILQQKLSLTQSQYNGDEALKITKLEKEVLKLTSKLSLKDKDIENIKQELNKKNETYATEIASLKHENEMKMHMMNKELESKGKNENQELERQKSFMSEQITFYKKQMEDNKKIQDKLLNYMEDKQNKSSESESRQVTSIADTNKMLTKTIEKMEFKTQQMETKIDRMKRFQKMIKCSNALQCKFCNKYFPSEVFSAHLSVCERERENTEALSDFYHKMSLTLCITQTLIKENEDHKPFTEYVINITYNSKTWQIHRRYKLFCTLNDQLRTEFPSVKFPTSSCQFENKSITEIFTRKRSRMIEDRRRVLQEYLIDLSLIPLIRESTTYKKFLGIDEHFPEQFLPYFQIANILGTPGEIVSNTQEILDPDTQLDAVSPDIYEMKKREEIGLESIVNQLDLDASLSPNTDQKIYTHPLPPGDYDHIGNNTYGSPNLHLFTTGGRYPNRLLDIDFMTEEQKVDTMEIFGGFSSPPEDYYNQEKEDEYEEKVPRYQKYESDQSPMGKKGRGVVPFKQQDKNILSSTSPNTINTMELEPHAMVAKFLNTNHRAQGQGQGHHNHALSAREELGGVRKSISFATTSRRTKEEGSSGKKGENYSYSNIVKTNVVPYRLGLGLRESCTGRLTKLEERKSARLHKSTCRIEAESSAGKSRRGGFNDKEQITPHRETHNTSNLGGNNMNLNLPTRGISPAMNKRTKFYIASPRKKYIE